jgi:hypothetical protein
LIDSTRASVAIDMRRRSRKEEVPQFHQLSRKRAQEIKERVEKIGRIYQKHLGIDVPIFITGSVIVHRAIAPLENWPPFDDMDTLVPKTKNAAQLKERMKRVRRACHELKGAFHAIHYAIRDQGHVGMRDVLAKGVCRFDDTSMIPRVTTVFTNTSLATQLKGAKPPAIIACPASAPDHFIVSDHRWLRSLRDRRFPPHYRSTSLSEESQDAQQLSYGPRGFLMEQWLGRFDKNKPKHGGGDDAKNRGEESKTQKDRIFASIDEAQWRLAVTAKIHYRAGAAWRDMRLLQGGMITIAGLHYAATTKSMSRFRLPFAILSLCVGAWIVENPSAMAAAHQTAGAQYGALEREWALLRTRIQERRVRYDWADAQAINLQRRKTKLDGESPNAPEFWKQGVITELRHKRANPDP